MKKSLIALLFFIFSFVIYANAIDRIFVKMPDEYYMFQGKESRAGLLKAYINKDTLGVKNRFGGKSYMLALDIPNDFLRVRNTQISTLEMKLWHTQTGKEIVGVNITTCIPMCDSNVGFFGENWQYLKDAVLPRIGIIDFLNVERIHAEGKKLEDIVAAFDLVYFQYVFPQEGTDIVVKLIVDKSLDADNKSPLLSYLKGKELTLVWKNDVFEKGVMSW
jgi:hypothetical protein